MGEMRSYKMIILTVMSLFPFFSMAEEKFENLLYSKIIECKLPSECDGNDICRIEVSVSMSDWLYKKLTFQCRRLVDPK